MYETYLIYYILSILLLPGIILGIIAQIRVTSTFYKYNQDYTLKGSKANEVAKKMLYAAGHTDVNIGRINGDLTDNFDPTNNTVFLSQTVYDSPTIAAVGVAAHEIGHVFQHKENYAPIKLRIGLARTINVLGFLAWPLIVVGLILELSYAIFAADVLLYIGLGIYGLDTIFCLVTLPVELNASSRAYKMLTATGELTEEEALKAKKVLNAAAWTYVAALITSILSLLRILFFILSIRDRR